MSDGWSSSRDETTAIEYATEPTHQRPVTLPPHPPRRVTRRFRRAPRTGSAYASQAVTVALYVLVGLLLVGLMVVANL